MITKENSISVDSKGLIYKKITHGNVSVELSKFPAQGSSEYHAMLQMQVSQDDAATQFKKIDEALLSLLQSDDLQGVRLVFKRYFVSDAINQASLIVNETLEHENAAVSLVQQPPLNGSKIALWAYLVENGDVQSNNEGATLTHVLTKQTTTLQRSHYKHLYTTQLHSHEKNELMETYTIFNDYTAELGKHGCSLKDNCIRTWIFVYGVDVHYTRMVNARRSYFDKEGLTDKTHYIASTGIEGKYMHADSIVLMDAYAVEGIKPEQVTYLKGLSHLNPTIEYGVTFERATAVDYGDRRHIYVSGTASIDNKGEVVHPHDIRKQIDRTVENIEVLLAEAESGMEDIAQMIVYLRDTADYQLVSSYMDQNYPSIPKVIVWAPVCRPGWLIEIECMAIKKIENKMFENF